MKCSYCEKEAIIIDCCEDHTLENSEHSYLVCSQCQSIVSITKKVLDKKVLEYCLSCQNCEIKKGE